VPFKNYTQIWVKYGQTQQYISLSTVHFLLTFLTQHLG